MYITINGIIETLIEIFYPQLVKSIVLENQVFLSFHLRNGAKKLGRFDHPLSYGQIYFNISISFSKSWMTLDYHKVRQKQKLFRE